MLGEFLCHASEVTFLPYSEYDSKEFPRVPRTSSKHKNFISVLVFVVLVFLLPKVSAAAVLINEVAWMGGADSANDEWIELYNNGESVANLDGWILTDNVSLEIELAGAVGAGEFAVLERTNDDSAPGTAFLLYTGALSNQGRILTLLRADGVSETEVRGGKNWETIGGSNETKETAQWTGGGWVTAVATPGKENVSVNTKSSRFDLDAQTSISRSNLDSSAGGDFEVEVIQTADNEPKGSLSAAPLPVSGDKNQALTISATDVDSDNLLPYLGLVAVIVLGTIGVYVRPKHLEVTPREVVEE